MTDIDREVSFEVEWAFVACPAVDFEVRNVFVDTEEDMIKRLRFIEWSNDLNWGAQQ